MHGTVDKYRVSSKHPATGRYDRWRIRWELPPDPYTDERRRGSSAGYPTRRTAEQRLAELMAEVSTATYVTPSRDRLSAYLTEWLRSLSVKPTTRDNYRTAAEVHVIPRLGGVALAELSAEQVDRLYRELERYGKRAGRCGTAGVTCRATTAPICTMACRRSRSATSTPCSVRRSRTRWTAATSDATSPTSPTRRRSGRPREAAPATSCGRPASSAGSWRRPPTSDSARCGS